MFCQVAPLGEQMWEMVETPGDAEHPSHVSFPSMRFTHQQHLCVVDLLLRLLLGSELGDVVLPCWVIVSRDEMDVVNTMQWWDLKFASLVVRKISSAPS